MTELKFTDECQYKRIMQKALGSSDIVKEYEISRIINVIIPIRITTSY